MRIGIDWRCGVSALALALGVTGVTGLTGCGREADSGDPAAAPTPEARIFRATVRRVDRDGLSLNFRNTVQITREMEGIPAEVGRLLPPGVGAEQSRIAVEALRIVIRTLAPTVLQGVASSTISPEPKIFVSKSFCYLGENMDKPSMFSFSGPNRAWPRLRTLPPDTRLACGGELAFGKFYERLGAEAKISAVPAVRTFPTLLEQQVKTACGESLPELLLASDGEFELLVWGTLEKPAAVLSISDKTGKLSAVLRKNLKIGPNTARFPLLGAANAAMKFAPVLAFEKNRLLLASDDTALDRFGAPAVGGGLLDTPAFVPLARRLPAESNGYLVLNLDGGFRDELLKSAAPRLRLAAARAGMDKLELRCVLAGVRESDGFGSIAATDFSMEELFGKLMMFGFAAGAAE